MTRAAAIAGRELRAYFLSPGGYIIIALFLLALSCIFRFGVFGDGNVASLRRVFGAGTWLLAFVAPAITMRQFSEEFRLGTYEALATCPVREAEIVAGKFLGALGLLAVMLLPSLAFVAALEIHGRPGPDYGELLCGFLGLLLAGAAFLASGLLASTLTSSQTVAFLCSLFFWLTLLVGVKLLAPQLGETAAGLVFAMDPHLRLKDFTIGLLDTSNVVYFLSLTGLFLLASIAVLQARRCW